MTDSDIIINDLPNVESLTFNYKQWSSFCSQVEGIKDKVFQINEKNIDNINYLVLYIGDMERYDKRFDNTTGIQDKLKSFNSPIFLGGKHSIQKIRDLLQSIKITVNLYKFNDEFYIEKKTQTTKTYFKLIEPKLFGTGNLSTSLILKASYVFNDNGNFKTKNVCLKVYPLDIYHQPAYNKSPDRLSNNNKKNLIDIAKFITIREGLIGCWVNTHLLNKNLFKHPITNTIMGVTDIFFANGKNLERGEKLKDGTGLPFTYEQLKTEKYNLTKIKNKYGKNWLNNYLDNSTDWFEKIANNQYGYIEMEPIDYTLRDLMRKKLFTLDMLFEIIYTKLCLQIIGNVTTPDDHTENIMTSLCYNVRKYIIKSRGHEFKFFISDSNKIKYIDLERTDIVTDRNFLSEDTAFISHEEYKEMLYYANPDDHPICEIIMKTLFSHSKLNLNRFCEFMYKVLPDKYIDESLYVNKPIEEYYLDLDVLDDTLKPNMLFKPRTTDIPKGQPYKSWNGTLEFPLLRSTTVTLPTATVPVIVGGNKQMYKLKIFE